MLDSLWHHLRRHLSAAVPGRCGVCHTWPADTVCEPCVVRFGQPVPRCQSCAIALPAALASATPDPAAPPLAGFGQRRCGQCLHQPPPLDACVAAVSYGYPWSGLVNRFKFGQEPGLAAMLAVLVRSMPWAEPALEQADCLVPVPLSTQRLQERGYNQAQALARALAPGQVNSAVLLRIKDTPSQRGQTRAERQASLKGAFAVDPLLARAVQGKRLLLVDDVMTSGATLYEAACALKLGGAAHVGAIVFARTEQK